MLTSTIDDLNLNRSFPGDPDGRPTSAIAHYVESELLPISDYLIDLHSGGSSLMYLPSVLAFPIKDTELAEKQIQMLSAFAAPLSYIATPNYEKRTMLGGAERTGVAAICTESGGSGTTTPHSLQVTNQGVRRVLKYLGSVPDFDVGEDPPPSRLMEICGPAYYVYSADYGMWEPLVDLGDEVVAGQPAAVVYCPQTPWREPVITHFEHAGKVICKRIPGGVHRGDCLFHLATDRDS